MGPAGTPRISPRNLLGQTNHRIISGGGECPPHQRRILHLEAPIIQNYPPSGSITLPAVASSSKHPQVSSSFSRRPLSPPFPLRLRRLDNLYIKDASSSTLQFSAQARQKFSGYSSWRWKYNIVLSLPKRHYYRRQGLLPRSTFPPNRERGLSQMSVLLGDSEFREAAVPPGCDPRALEGGIGPYLSALLGEKGRWEDAEGRG
uniref:Uncharacterized protein n=1 Tax=Odontella aurita TaxID=265563 RepID=A0A7S4J125_9STRA|mmetsp:Transcript_35400/g.105743  ORF Transcript_35400/g.105743 Transcript_35400/m.105743 type:complete len:203 (+) Transcript_35400:69-677(+)